jgi:hypothetical protein
VRLAESGCRSGSRSYTIATYVALVALSLGALLILGPMLTPPLGQWLLSAGLISGVTAERMAWGPIALFGTLIPGSIAFFVGLISAVVAAVLRIRRQFRSRGTHAP